MLIASFVTAVDNSSSYELKYNLLYFFLFWCGIK